MKIALTWIISMKIINIRYMKSPLVFKKLFFKFLNVNSHQLTTIL